MLLCVGEGGISFTKLVSKYSLYKIRSVSMIDVDNILWSHLHVLFYLFHLLSSFSFQILHLASFFFKKKFWTLPMKQNMLIVSLSLAYFTYCGVFPTLPIFMQMTQPQSFL